MTEGDKESASKFGRKNPEPEHGAVEQVISRMNQDMLEQVIYLQGEVERLSARCHNLEARNRGLRAQIKAISEQLAAL